MTGDDSDLYRVDGSKVWLSPTAIEYAAQYFGPGRKGREQFARYLQLRHQMQIAALSPPDIGVHGDELATDLGVPGGLQQEYEVTTEGAQQEQQGLPPDDSFLPPVLLD